MVGLEAELGAGVEDLVARFEGGRREKAERKKAEVVKLAMYLVVGPGGGSSEDLVGGGFS